MVRQAVLLQSMEVNGGADIYLQSVEDPPPEQVDALKGGCDTMESPCWSKLLAGPVAPWREEPTPEQECIKHLLVLQSGLHELLLTPIQPHRKTVIRVGSFIARKNLEEHYVALNMATTLLHPLVTGLSLYFGLAFTLTFAVSYKIYI
ncbi:AN1-type zinc finger protein 5-like [Grus japonensis]|uniref:AN1-type zinc finger protein 5-like n=1 Tax=Grus japonensis TaxID=30415 RepID=A0ABC9WH30_GRUJA